MSDEQSVRKTETVLGEGTQYQRLRRTDRTCLLTWTVVVAVVAWILVMVSRREPWAVESGSSILATRFAAKVYRVLDAGLPTVKWNGRQLEELGRTRSAVQQVDEAVGLACVSIDHLERTLRRYDYWPAQEGHKRDNCGSRRWPPPELLQATLYVVERLQRCLERIDEARATAIDAKTAILQRQERLYQTLGTMLRSSVGGIEDADGGRLREERAEIQQNSKVVDGLLAHLQELRAIVEQEYDRFGQLLQGIQGPTRGSQLTCEGVRLLCIRVFRGERGNIQAEQDSARNGNSIDIET